MGEVPLYPKHAVWGHLLLEADLLARPAEGALVTAAHRHPSHPHILATGFRLLPATAHSLLRWVAKLTHRKIDRTRCSAGKGRSCGDARGREREKPWAAEVRVQAGLRASESGVGETAPFPLDTPLGYSDVILIVLF